jgi:hypothetical protein
VCKVQEVLQTEECCILRNLMMGEACGTYGRVKNLKGSYVWRPEKWSNLQDLDIDRRIILKWALNTIG